jgi:hypothetical protein
MMARLGEAERQRGQVWQSKADKARQTEKVEKTLTSFAFLLEQG